MTLIHPSQSLPFAQRYGAFRELSERLPRAEELPMYSNAGRMMTPVREAQLPPPPPPLYNEYEVKRSIMARAHMYEGESVQARLFRHGQWLALILAIAFIATIVVMMAVFSIRLNSVFEDIDGQDATAKLHTMMDLAVQGAENARLATQNVLHVTAYARDAASIAAPRLVHAVNETSDLVEDLRSWSFHPSLSIAPGLKSPG